MKKRKTSKWRARAARPIDFAATSVDSFPTSPPNPPHQPNLRLVPTRDLRGLPNSHLLHHSTPPADASADPPRFLPNPSSLLARRRRCRHRIKPVQRPRARVSLPESSGSGGMGSDSKELLGIEPLELRFPCTVPPLNIPSCRS
jgi:hypothetical protein